MAVPVTAAHDVKDKAGRPIRAGSKVRLAGGGDPVEVHQIDPRYGVLVVLVPGRANQMMGAMVRASEVEVV
jgi:hypothetical protein